MLLLHTDGLCCAVQLCSGDLSLELAGWLGAVVVLASTYNANGLRCDRWHASET